jgi:glycyl-tRNA synthetase beta chain
MVGEFPELQGVMGRYYALAQKEDGAVADAIRDHYLPLGPDSPVPSKPVSICVALADKFDTLISMFAAGEKPTGSKDPFALRRSALGIIRIILENNLRLKLHVILSTAELIAFFGDRLAVQLKDQGIRHDVVSAIMASGDDDLTRVIVRAKALQDFLKTEDGTNLLIAYKRATNIVEIAEKKYEKEYSPLISWNTLIEQEELSLLKAINEVNTKYKDIFEQEKFTEVMGLIATLRKPVDAFFDKVLVNVDDTLLRDARLSLLSYIRLAINNVADFSLIEG